MGTDIALVLGLLKVGLDLWKDARAEPIQKAFIKLTGDLNDEKLLGENSSDKRIDELERELLTLASSFIYAIKSK